MRRRSFIAALLASIFAPPLVPTTPAPRYLYHLATFPILAGDTVKLFKSWNQSFALGIETPTWSFVDSDVEWHLSRVDE